MRFKIIYTLIKYGDLPISNLSKLARVKFNVLKRELNYLSEKGYIEILSGERAKIVRLNYTNQKIIILKNLLEELDDL
ncbi:hypothetical protein GFB69_01735 [Acidianus ambivalens]|uniref:Uncharacterized protein n=1 Tax=Acidianus ambivalens TaxID=2283 RepID=A0A650CYJ5_ACIAM|nr:hypothetical protein [Acidianus ambivalens]QGR22921.1 hypothetical protein D1866_10295 [Acidianus ambivalens]